MRRLVLMLLALASLAATTATADPVGTGFTFQGYLEKDAAPYSGPGDFQIKLFDAAGGGAQVGATTTHVNVPVTQGLFTLGLDFGAVFDGNARWLEISVQCPGDPGWTQFGGRLPLQAAPYAQWAPGGGGAFSLPFTGSATQVGPTSGNDPNTSVAAARFENLATLGMSNGVTGVTQSSRSNSAGVVGIGAAANGSTTGVLGVANASTLGRGVTGLGLAYGGYFVAQGSTGTGVLAISTEGTGVDAASTTGTALRGLSSTGTGVYAESNYGWGLWSVAHAANAHGVFGQAWGDDGNGVIGRNEASTGAGVYGYSPNGAVGVLAIAEQADGLSARTNANGKSAVFGYAGAASAFGGYFTGVAGSTPLKVDGMAEVRSLKILGADLAERFPVREPALEPGTVLMLDDGGAPGLLRTCDEVYSHRVAGVVSGANGLDAAVVLSGGAFDADGHATVALSGRVWVKCDASSAPIHPGDLLTSAPRAGHAMRAGNRGRAYGATLGKAMTSLEAGTGLVLVLVNLQ
ncbi:MAG: hypothetical protein U0704_06155 [Candidatus Eisenbacteria bacterium]